MAATFTPRLDILPKNAYQNRQRLSACQQMSEQPNERKA